MAARILIVDDDADLRSSLAYILGSLFEVQEAADGAAALDILKMDRHALMLLDVSMPGMSGLEVLEAAKVLNPALIVVMLTSQQDIDIAAKALNLGAAEYVTKPFDAAYIRAEVALLTGKPDKPNARPWKVVP